LVEDFASHTGAKPRLVVSGNHIHWRNHMSDEIKKEPVDDPKPVKEFSADELGQVNGGSDYADFWKAVGAMAAGAAASAANNANKTGKS
jgi:hypothetical protein